MTEGSKLSTAYTSGPDLTAVLRSGREYTGKPMAPDHPFGGIYAIMDRNGMLPDEIFCLRCAKPLNADGNHPAELYAGTFNGLCYGCTSEGPYVAAVAVLDGCRSISWAPSEPSYRRDREKFYGYEGCENCQGMGVAGYRSTGGHWYGGRARVKCEPCWKRYFAHPARIASSRWHERIMRSCQASYEQAIDQAAGVPAKCTKKRRTELRETFMRAREEGQRRSPECEALRLIYMAGYERINEQVKSHFAALHVNEWTDQGRTQDEFFRLYCKWRGFDYDQVMADGGKLPPPPTPEQEAQAERDKLIARLRAHTLGEVESWYYQGMCGVGQAEWEAYVYAWARGAAHLSGQYDSYAYPFDDEVRQLGNAIMGDKAPGVCPEHGENCTRLKGGL